MRNAQRFNDMLVIVKCVVLFSVYETRESNRNRSSVSKLRKIVPNTHSSKLELSHSKLQAAVDSFYNFWKIFFFTIRTNQNSFLSHNDSIIHIICLLFQWMNEWMNNIYMCAIYFPLTHAVKNEIRNSFKDFDICLFGKFSSNPNFLLNWRIIVSVLMILLTLEIGRVTSTI